MGIEAREHKDNSQWLLGDIANDVQVFYGEDSIGKLGNEISVKKSTLMTYRHVSRAFRPNTRIPDLSFTHHQIASHTDDPTKWLNLAGDNEWTCEQMSMHIKQDMEESGAETIAQIRLALMQQVFVNYTQAIGVTEVNHERVKLYAEQAISVSKKRSYDE